VGVETERKFRVPQPPDWLERCPFERIEQGYVAAAEGEQVRVRLRNGAAVLTVKRGQGRSRLEDEVELTAAQLATLWPLAEGRRLSKRRYTVEHDPPIEVDVYEGPLTGLVVAEVEFESDEAADGFAAPGWLGEELTGDERFSNLTLALEGAQPDALADRGSSRTYRLDGDERVADGLRRIAREQADDAIEQLREQSEGLPAAVHEARKDLKKIRSVLRLVQSRLGADTYQRENQRYRDAGRLLSSTRDAEVKVATLEQLGAHYAHDIPPVAEPLAAALERDRRQSSRDAEGESAGVEQAVAAVEAGRVAIADWPLEGSGWELVGKGLARGYRRGRRAFHETVDGDDPETVHEWRKRVKDLWYHLRLLRDAWEPVVGGLADEAHELADLLGDHHDLHVLAVDVAARHEMAASGEDPGPLVTMIERRQDELLDEAVPICERLYAEKPKAFVGRVHDYWRAWRID
jgi:CYTH domain-containing protein